MIMKNIYVRFRLTSQNLSRGKNQEHSLYQKKKKMGFLQSPFKSERERENRF